MRLWKLAAPVIFACACTTTIEGPLYDGFADDGTTGGSSASGGVTSSGGSTTATGGTVGTASASTGGTSSSGTSGGSGLGGTGFGGSGLGGTGFGGSGLAGSGLGGTGLGGVGAGGGAGFGNAGTGGSALGGASGAGVAGSGPAAGTGTGGATGATFAQVSDIIVRVCATSRCHGGRENPNLTAANLYTTLTTTMVRQCGNDRMVTPSDPANSAVLEVVKGQCGNLVMPEGCDTTPCLDAPELTTITDWITAGALR